MINRYTANVRGISDVVNTYYIAPEFVGRVPTRNNKNVWIFTVSAGYVSYNEKIEMLSYSNGGFKSTLEAGFDIRLGGAIFLGFKLAVTSGAINFKADGKNYKESLNAIELGGGLRF